MLYINLPILAFGTEILYQFSLFLIVGSLLYFTIGVLICLTYYKIRKKNIKDIDYKSGWKTFLIFFTILIFTSLIIQELYIPGGNNPTIEDCKKRVSSADICLSQLAQKELDPNICTELVKIGEKAEADFCYIKIAVNKSDETICQKIGNGPGTYWLRGRCYNEIAVKTKNSLLCDKIDLIEEREDCYKKFHQCDKITIKQIKELCV